MIVIDFCFYPFTSKVLAREAELGNTPGKALSQPKQNLHENFGDQVNCSVIMYGYLEFLLRL
jgi:hypothetical protein